MTAAFCGGVLNLGCLVPVGLVVFVLLIVVLPWRR